MQLPNLRSWVGTHEPPQTLPPVTFPSLEELRLEPAALPWLHLLASHRGETIQKGFTPVVSRTNIRETLKSLECTGINTIDSAFASSVANFRNLVDVQVTGYCLGLTGCISRITDGDIEDLATALPRLTSVKLLRPCGLNSGKTTILSLLSLSIHCLGLHFLEIHFNTRTIIGDIQRLLDGNFGGNKAKCKLWNLVVGEAPLEVDEEDIETIVMGLRLIFPCLKTCSGVGQWESVRTALSTFDQ